MADGSVTEWLQMLKAGDAGAAAPLWDAYFPKLVQVARNKMRHAARRVSDEEDVALSAFKSLCRGAAQDRFKRLDDRDDLWQLLVVLTARKAIRHMTNEQRQKRGGGQVRGETEILQHNSDGEALNILDVIGREPTLDFAMQMAEECDCLLHQLGDEELRLIALWKMEGYSNEEMAEMLQCAPRSIGRKLQRIRSIWIHEGPS